LSLQNRQCWIGKLKKVTLSQKISAKIKSIVQCWRATQASDIK